MRTRLLTLILCGVPGLALAKPVAPSVVDEVFLDAVSPATCNTCHSAQPAKASNLNAFGLEIQAQAIQFFAFFEWKTEESFAIDHFSIDFGFL